VFDKGTAKNSSIEGGKHTSEVESKMYIDFGFEPYLDV